MQESIQGEYCIEREKLAREKAGLMEQGEIG
jgi:hypothetical protein